MVKGSSQSVCRIKWSKTCGFKAKGDRENGTEDIIEEGARTPENFPPSAKVVNPRI